jgi:DNA-binding Lrp family transcriptional regulator
VDSAQPAIADSQNDARPITLTQTDKALIRILQEDIGNELEPYERIADALGQAQSWVLSRTQELIDAGVIRRFGAMVRHNELGFTHNVMVAWIIPDDETDAAGGIMAGYSAVSHCYRRVTTEDWPYNMYAMTHGMSEDDCATAIRQIKAALDDAGVSYKEPALLRSIKELKKSSMRYFIEDER